MSTQGLTTNKVLADFFYRIIINVLQSQINAIVVGLVSLVKLAKLWKCGKSRQNKIVSEHTLSTP